MTRAALAAAATVAALVLPLAAAACGGGADATAPVATTEVSMAKSYRFEPETIEISAGDTVTWVNEDNFTHTVEVEGRPDRRAEPGERVSIRFDERGTFRYVCTLHRRDMDGVVIVR